MASSLPPQITPHLTPSPPNPIPTTVAQNLPFIVYLIDQDLHSLRVTVGVLSSPAATVFSMATTVCTAAMWQPGEYPAELLQLCESIHKSNFNAFGVQHSYTGRNSLYLEE